MPLRSARVTLHDPAGAEVEPIGPGDVAELHRLLRASGLGHVELEQRYSVVFVYPGLGAGRKFPELSGCTEEVCSFADRTEEFSRHGIQLIGLSTQPDPVPDDFLLTLPFPIGQLPAEVETELLRFVERSDQRYAVRTSFLLFPDGSGSRIGNIRDPAGHVDGCFDAAVGRRLRNYERDLIDYLEKHESKRESAVQHGEFLANGADSVSISSIDFRLRLVAKMADPAIIAQEGGYISEVNRMLEEAGHPRVFPTVYAVRDGERPGYYLMEAAEPLTLDKVLFDDESMTTLRNDKLHLLAEAMTKLANLYTISFEQREPAIARYHYLDRFLAIPERQDFRSSFKDLFGTSELVEDLLGLPVEFDGDFVGRSYREQMQFLREHVHELVQPVSGYLHGDVHLKNMLVSRERQDVLFVDPRVIWDEFDVGEPGFGDPLYDYGTLLHSLHTMSAILNAIETKTTERLLPTKQAMKDGRRFLEAEGGILSFRENSTVPWFIGWLGTTVPERILGANWTARLHVNTANALVGWLKYARAVRTKHAWLAIFASVLYHLEVARRLIEEPQEVSL